MSLSDKGLAFVSGLRDRLSGHSGRMETEVLALANRMDLGESFKKDRVGVTRELGELLQKHGLVTEPDLSGTKKRVVFVDIMADPDWTPPVEVERVEEAAPDVSETSEAVAGVSDAAGEEGDAEVEAALDEMDEMVHPHLSETARAMLVWIRAQLSEALSGGEPVDFALSELIERRGVFPPSRMSSMAVQDVADFLEDHGIHMDTNLGALSPETRVKLHIGDPERDPGTQIVEDIVKLTVVIAKADDDLGEAEQASIEDASSSALLEAFKRGPMPLRGMLTRLMKQEEPIDVLNVSRRLAQWLTRTQREALMDRLVNISVADKHLDAREEAVLADIAFAFGLDVDAELKHLRELYGEPPEDRAAVGEESPVEDETVDEIMDLLGL